jgi:hypothetical protein
MAKSSEMFKPVAQLLSQAKEARKEAGKFSSLQPYGKQEIPWIHALSELAIKRRTHSLVRRKDPE